MSKKNVMISIDDQIHKSAKELLLNISHVAEGALKRQISPSKSMIPEDQLKMVCYKCDAIVDDGFYCEAIGKFMCVGCEVNHKCLKQDHQHTRIPGYDGQNKAKAEVIQNG